MYNWEVAEALFKENSLVQHHLDSYNEFINHKIHKVVEELNEIEIEKSKLSVKLHKVRLEQPVVMEADGSRRAIMPMEARLRKRTYSAPIFLEMSLDDYAR